MNPGQKEKTLSFILKHIAIIRMFVWRNTTVIVIITILNCLYSHTYCPALNQKQSMTYLALCLKNSTYLKHWASEVDTHTRGGVVELSPESGAKPGEGTLWSDPKGQSPGHSSSIRHLHPRGVEQTSKHKRLLGARSSPR